MTQEIDQPREIPQGVEQSKVPEWTVVYRQEVSGRMVVTLGSNLDLSDITDSDDVCPDCESPTRRKFMVDWDGPGDGIS